MLQRMSQVGYALAGPVLTTSQVEILKYIALLSMTLSHIYTVFGIGGQLMFDIGRFAFPVFAFVMAYNYVHHTRDAKMYLLRMLAIAIVAEAPYQYVFQRETFMLNIMFSLALGLAAMIYLDYLFDKACKSDIRMRWLHWYLFITAAFVTSFFVDYIHFGTALMISYWAWLRYPSHNTFSIAMLFTILLNLPNGMETMVWGAASLLLIGIVSQIGLRVPRLNKWFYYSFYPLHFLVIQAFVMT